jgi:hypothetical protein
VNSIDRLISKWSCLDPEISKEDAAKEHKKWAREKSNNLGLDFIALDIAWTLIFIEGVGSKLHDLWDVSRMVGNDLD